MGLRLLKDLTDALGITVDPQCRTRLTEADLPTFRAALKASGLTLTLGPEASNQLLRLVRQYDVYLFALSAWLVIPLPSWIPTIHGGQGQTILGDHELAGSYSPTAPCLADE